MIYNTMIFSNKWFKENQKLILFLLNFPIPKYREYFRYKLGLIDLDEKIKIVKIGIDNYQYKLDNEYNQGFFYSNNPISKQFYFGFLDVWENIHKWDLYFANKYVPAFNLGFDTLDVYPEAAPETYACDGYTYAGTGSSLTYATIHSRNGDYGDGGTSTNGGCRIVTTTTTDRFSYLVRGMYFFNLVDLLSAYIVSSASIFLTPKNMYTGLSESISIVQGYSSSNVTIAAADHQANTGTTKFVNDNARSTYSAESEKEHALIAAGLTYLDTVKESIAKFCVKNTSDVANSAPTWSSNKSDGIDFYMADNGSKKPKLSIIYSTSVTTSNQLLL